MDFRKNTCVRSDKQKQTASQNQVRNMSLTLAFMWFLFQTTRQKKKKKKIELVPVYLWHRNNTEAGKINSCGMVRNWSAPQEVQHHRDQHEWDLCLCCALTLSDQYVGRFATWLLQG